MSSLSVFAKQPQPRIVPEQYCVNCKHMKMVDQVSCCEASLTLMECEFDYILGKHVSTPVYNELQSCYVVRDSKEPQCPEFSPKQ